MRVRRRGRNAGAGRRIRAANRNGPGHPGPWHRATTRPGRRWGCPTTATMAGNRPRCTIFRTERHPRRVITPGARHRTPEHRTKGREPVFTARASASKTHATPRPHRPGTGAGRAMHGGCRQGARPDRTAPDRCPDPLSRNGHLARDPPGRARAALAGACPAGRCGETRYRDLPPRNVARRGGRLPAGSSAPTAVTGPWRARPPRARHGSRRGRLPDPHRERSARPRRHGHDRAGRGVRRPPRGRGHHRSHAPPAAHHGDEIRAVRHPPPAPAEQPPPPLFSIENTSRRRRRATRCDSPGHPG